MPRIRQLSPALINQIAAGEVIERPASVVKELVENAIDAGAQHIHIDIEEAGSKLIRVRDDGSGIHAEDLALAFSTHATSKIRSFEDLERVLTLGFRGEALPSIASVSKTTLSSRHHQAEHGAKIAPHLSMDIGAAAHPVGTTIEVRDLFYNTPARKKFLKSERTERQHIMQLLARIALSQQNIRLTLHDSGKKIADYGGSTPAERLNSVLGDEFLQQAVAIDNQKSSMHLHGWVGLPTYHSNNSDKQFFFVNGRMVRDKITVHAIKQAYQDMLYHGRQPIFVLYLDIDPELVDVNAHPQKYEVRFREAALTHDFIFSTLHHSLRAVRPQHISIIPAAQEETKPSSPATPPPPSMRPQSLAWQKSSDYHQDSPRPSRPSLQETKSYYQWASPKTAAQIETPPQEEAGDYPLGFALGQIHGIFIVAENRQGLVIVDMHAAHERIIYEKFKSQLRQKSQGNAQKLLVPQTLVINPMQEDLLAEHTQWLSALGYQWRIEGGELLIDSVPELLKKADNAAILADVLNELAEYPHSRAIERLQDQILSTMSCHRAIRAHHKLSLSEMNQVLRDIENTPAAGQCNHGRPTWTQLSEEQLGALFMRGQ